MEKKEGQHSGRKNFQKSLRARAKQTSNRISKTSGMDKTQGIKSSRNF